MYSKHVGWSRYCVRLAANKKVKDDGKGNELGTVR
jgi:hypothetical protein